VGAVEQDCQALYRMLQDRADPVDVVEMAVTVAVEVQEAAPDK
jgi:hypothetical protein